MQAAVDRMTEYSIPHDAQWGDIDIMERLDNILFVMFLPV